MELPQHHHSAQVAFVAPKLIKIHVLKKFSGEDTQDIYSVFQRSQHETDLVNFI